MSYPLWQRVEEETRRKRGWSWAELSRRSGVRRATIAALATNSEPPRADNVNRLADTLGIDRGEAHLLARGGPVGDAEDSSVRTAILRSRRLKHPQKDLLIQLHDEMVRSNREPEQAQPELRVVDGDN